MDDQPESIQILPPNPTPTPKTHKPPHPQKQNPTQFRFTPPSAVISGFLGLALYDIMGACSKLLQVELESTLRSIEVNMCVRLLRGSVVLGFGLGGR